MILTVRYMSITENHNKQRHKNMTVTDTEKDLLYYPLKHYLRNEYMGLCDYDYVIENREEILIEYGEVIYKYNCPCQTIYLDIDGYAVNYDKQHIIEENYYYDFNTDNTGAGTYTYIAPLEWKRSSIGD